MIENTTNTDIEKIIINEVESFGISRFLINDKEILSLIKKKLGIINIVNNNSGIWVKSETHKQQ